MRDAFGWQRPPRLVYGIFVDGIALVVKVEYEEVAARPQKHGRSCFENLGDGSGWAHGEGWSHKRIDGTEHKPKTYDILRLLLMKRYPMYT